jgi:hypothetical protein
MDRALRAAPEPPRVGGGDRGPARRRGSVLADARPARAGDRRRRGVRGAPARKPVAGADFQNTLGLGEDHRFERTERIPVERVQAAGEYVRDTDEWIARCVARVLALDPIIKAEEASRSVGELAELERWRLMKPEAAAEQLYTPIRPR